MESTDFFCAQLTIFVGGIGELYQGDLDFGRIVVERLADFDLGPGVIVEDLHYGAVAVTQRLQEIAPQSLVLVGAAPRGRKPGTVERRRIRDLRMTPEEIQQSVGDAVTGYVTMDLAVEVVGGLGGLPDRTVAIEVEPVSTDPSEHLSHEAMTAVDEALALVLAEIRRAPLLELASQLRPLVLEDRLEPSGALDAVRGLLHELEALDEEGRWGATFALRDRLKQRIAEGETGLGMDHLDWGLWWALIEELDRLQPLESVPDPSAR